jgi:predicted dehydrogenase
MIQVAIIGAGGIADSHIEAYLQFRDRCEIVALVDIYINKAQEKIDKYKLNAKTYHDHHELLNKEKFDLASICTPPFEHARTTIDLLNAGKNVLCEKPMATCLAECDAMIDAARKNNQMLAIVAQNRFRTPMMKLKKLLELGVAGKIVHAQVDSFWWRGSNYYDLWWRGTWEKEGGGCTLNHAVHQIDLFHWMMGMPQSLQSVVANAAHDNSEVEDFSTTVMFYPDHKIGQLNASLLHHGEPQQFVAQGECATIGVPWRVRAMSQRENGFPQDNPELEKEIQARFDQLPELEHELHTGQIENVLDALEGKAQLLIDGAQGRNTIELVTAIYASGFTGQRVALPLTPDNPFYTREGILQNAMRFHQKTKSVENFADSTITVGSTSDQKK